MANILPSVAYMTNIQLPQSNGLLTVSKWDDLSTSLDEYVDQRPNQTNPLTHPILNIVQATPLVRLQMTQQTQPVTAMTHVASIRTPKVTIWYAISVYKLINPTPSGQTSSRTSARKTRCFASQENPNDL